MLKKIFALAALSATLLTAQQRPNPRSPENRSERGLNAGNRRAHAKNLLDVVNATGTLFQDDGKHKNGSIEYAVDYLSSFGERTGNTDKKLFADLCNEGQVVFTNLASAKQLAEKLVANPSYTPSADDAKIFQLVIVGLLREREGIIAAIPPKGQSAIFDSTRRDEFQGIVDGIASLIAAFGDARDALKFPSVPPIKANESLKIGEQPYPPLVKTCRLVLIPRQ
jgi:hypothetical protein